MRAFDGLEDVKTYLTERAAKADETCKATVAKPDPKGWLGKIERARVLAANQAARASYLDALAALDEIKPGLIEAFETGKVSLRLLDTDNDRIFKSLVAELEALINNNQDWVFAKRQMHGVHLHSKFQRLRDELEGNEAEDDLLAKVDEAMERLLVELFGIKS